MTWFQVLVIIGIALVVATQIYGMHAIAGSLERIENLLRSLVSLKGRADRSDT